MKKLIFALFGFCAATLIGVPVAFAQSRGNAPDDPAAVSVLVRCAYWERPESTPPPLFIKSRKGYRSLPVFAMAFGAPIEYRGPTPIPVCRKASDEEIEQRKAEGVKASDREYIPLFSINPGKLKDIGVVLLAGKNGAPAGRNMLVFDWSEEAFPYGTVRIANFSKQTLIGQLLPRDSTPERFTLKDGGFYVSKPVGAERRVYGIQLAAMVNKKPEIICSTNAVFRDNSRVMLFVIPKSRPKPGEIPDIDFRSIKDYKRPEVTEPANGTGGDKGRAPRRGNPAPPREK